MGDFIRVGDLPIHVTDVHKECDFALVFIHGRCMSERIWERQVTSPELRGYRLITFDLPGHGQSGFSDETLQDYSLAGSVRILEALIAKLNIKSFILVGVSLGAHIALQCIEKLSGCKGVFAMTLPLQKPIQPAHMYIAAEQMEKAFQENSAEEDVVDYLRLLLSKRDQLPEFLKEDFKKADVRVHHGLLAGIVAGDYQDETSLFDAPYPPIALVQGIDEQLHDLRYGQALSLPHLWRGEILIVAGAGHCPNWENPEQVNLLIKDFAAACKAL
jgi:pimeloyl-ACP methyl ester carboxylesterase